MNWSNVIRSKLSRSPESAKGKNLWILPVMIALLTGCGQKHESPRSQAPAARVQAVDVQFQRVPDIYEAVGTVRPKLFAEVSSRITATIQRIHVRAGDKVASGQSMAELDDRDLRAEFNRAKDDYERFKSLLEKNAATRAEFDAVQSRFRVADANLSYANIVAPFDGVVAQKSCDVGDLAEPGKTLFTIEQPTAFRLEAQVPERLAGAVALGMSADVRVDATGEKCAGKVGEIVPAADPATRTVLVKIDLQCRQPLKSGMFGRAQLDVGKREGLFVSALAVHERGQLTFVFVVANRRAQMRLVKTGKVSSVGIEVLSGLQPGERVITSSEKELTDGQPIHP